MSRVEPSASRKAIIDEVVAAALAPREGVVFDLEGPRGSGRSTLLDAVHARLDPERGCTAVMTDLAPYVHDSASGAELVGKYETLLRDLAEMVAGDREGFNERVRGVPSARVDEPGSAEVRADGLTVALAEELARVLTGKRLVLLVHNASAPTGELSHWFKRLLERLVGGAAAVAVLSRGVEAGEPPDWPGRVVRRRMPPLDRADVAQLLSKRSRSDSPASERVVDVVFEWSGGHALAVVAAADLVSPTTDADELERALAAPPAELVAEITPALDHMLAADERTRAAVEVAATLRNFDKESVEFVLDRLRLQPPGNLELVLANLAFQRPGREVREGTSALCDFFRILVEGELKGAPAGSAGGSRLVEIHQAATEYYKGRLRRTVENRGEVYARWELIEDAETETLALDLLHHAARVDDRDYARSAFAAVYFDVFWWWGSYLDAPSASRLLDEWERSQPGGPDESELVAEYRRFQESYIPASELWPPPADRNRERWQNALDALELIRGRLFDRAPELLAEDRHVLGVVSALMGDALRQLDVTDRRADRRYEDALALFRKNADEAALALFGENAEEAAHAQVARTSSALVEDDEWCTAWALYYLADLALERGDIKGAATHAREALRIALDPDLADKDRDYEVISNCHRVLGDTMVERDPVKAFREYLRAVFAAYVFHAEFPDEYTRLFHREQTSRAIERLGAVWSTRGDEALEICNGLSEWRLTRVDAPELERMLRDGSWDELQTALFPREPSPDELDCDTAYAQQVRLVRRKRGPHLLAPVPEEASTKLRRLLPGRGGRDAGSDDAEPCW